MSAAAHRPQHPGRKNSCAFYYGLARPSDRGPYGIEDTRKALIETRHMGIYPYVDTIDTDALEYLPHRYGETDFTIIDQVDKLPQRIVDIYRRLAT